MLSSKTFQPDPLMTKRSNFIRSSRNQAVSFQADVKEDKSEQSIKPEEQSISDSLVVDIEVSKPQIPNGR